MADEDRRTRLAPRDGPGRHDIPRHEARLGDGRRLAALSCADQSRSSGPSRTGSKPFAPRSLAGGKPPPRPWWRGAQSRAKPLSLA